MLFIYNLLYPKKLYRQYCIEKILCHSIIRRLETYFSTASVIFLKTTPTTFEVHIYEFLFHVVFVSSQLKQTTSSKISTFKEPKCMYGMGPPMGDTWKERQTQTTIWTVKRRWNFCQVSKKKLLNLYLLRINKKPWPTHSNEVWEVEK